MSEELIVNSPRPSRTRASFVLEMSSLENVSNDGAGLGGRAVGVGSGRGEGMGCGVGIGVGASVGVGGLTPALRGAKLLMSGSHVR